MATQNSKVILLIRNADKSDFGGAETYQVSVAEILIKEGFSPVIVSRSQKMLDYARGKAIKTHKGWWWSRQNWSGKRALLFPVYILWQLVLVIWYIALIYKLKASALHIQSKDDFIGATIAARITGRNAVWTDHMDLRYVFQNISQPFKNPVGKFVFWAAQFAQHIILISDNEYKLVTDTFKSKNALKQQITIVKNGVIDRLNSITPSKDTSNFTYCLASRIVENKGIGEAVDAFIKLTNQHNDFNATLAIYGDGADIDTYKEKATNHPSIHFFGHQVNAIEKIAASDVFMLPSYQEGFSIALLEATMLGKAIIASSVDSNPEIIHDETTGLLVPPRSIDSLADAMFQLYSDHELLASLEKNARENYLQHYNLEDIVKDAIIPLYTAR